MITSIFYEKNKLNYYKLMPHLSLFGINNTFIYHNKFPIEKNHILFESINNSLIIKEEINRNNNLKTKKDDLDESYVFINKPKD